MPTPHDILDDLNNYQPPTRSEATTMFDDEEEYDAAYRTPQTAAEAIVDDNLDEPPAEPTADDDGCESIGGYHIHPAATFFPLLTGGRFDELVASIRNSGQTSPIMQTEDGLILDGRNRLRAIQRLRKEGHEIEPWIDVWEPADGQTEGEYILAANLHRRHLTDDQRAMIVAELMPFIEIGPRERQKATQIKKGEARNRAGQNQHSAQGIAETETSPPSKERKKTSAEKEANSARGKLSTIAAVSSHKAGKALTVKKSGDKQIIQNVKDGKMKLAKAEEAVKPLKKTTEPYDLERDVTTRWTRWMDKWPAADHPDVRKIVVRLIKEGEKRVSEAKG